MTDRIPSDHASVRTVRGKLARSGGTRRPCLRVPDELADSLDAGDYVRLVLDGDAAHARVSEDATGLVIRGAYDDKSLARDPGDAPNRLVEWVDANDRPLDSAVEVDEVESGYFYGVRVPGRRAVYAPSTPPADSLASIAEKLDGDG
ncbi:hypothetical protein ACFO0N_09165 [Halobium salinum]|uniref:Uncharacterized protein n=1 Tax=Halobium salinum TaxID=1364940 RepID=A0ABD5PCC1_9EURY|nr:hypothetical protein [Halobium salinum]